MDDVFPEGYVTGALMPNPSSSRKRPSGRSAPAVAIRTTGPDVRQELVGHVRRRLGFKLGKLAQNIERVSVRFEEASEPRGGAHTACRIKVVLRRLPTVVVEEIAATQHAAFDRAGNAVEAAVRRAIAHAHEVAAARAAGK